MTPEEIKELRELLSVFADDEWVEEYDPHADVWSIKDSKRGTYIMEFSIHSKASPFVLAARNALPKLLDEIERLQKRNQELQDHYECKMETPQRISEIERKVKLLQDVVNMTEWYINGTGDGRHELEILLKAARDGGAL